MKKTLYLAAALALPSLAGCATIAPPAREPAEIAAVPSALALTFSLDVKHTFALLAAECSLDVAEKDKGGLHEIRFPAKTSDVVVSLPPGTWVARRLYCGGPLDWQFDSRSIAWRVYPGSISYGGTVTSTVDGRHVSVVAQYSGTVGPSMAKLLMPRSGTIVANDGSHVELQAPAE